MQINGDDIITWVGGATGVGVLVRLAITVLKKQGLTDAGIDSQKTALAEANERAAYWEKKYEAEVANHAATSKEYAALLINAGELRNQNRFLRMLLKQGGMSTEEIDAALEIPDAE